MIKGTIFFPTCSALAVWREEILGQLSDGAWENTAPDDHWKFWQRLATAVDASGAPRVELAPGASKPYRQKTGYNIATLYEWVGDRMMAYGKMGLALASWPDIEAGDKTFNTCVGAAEYMAAMGPDTFFSRKCDTSPVSCYRDDLMRAVPEELARRFFATKYEMKHLRADVKLIKAAMKTVATL